MNLHKYYENLSLLHENVMPNRAYYIPASKRMENIVDHRELSDRFQLLNGDWKFKYFSSVYDLKDEFYGTEYDTSEYDVIPVPSVWQNHGYDQHQYVNSRYPFPFDPPYVPTENPCGAYVSEFPYEKDENAPCAYLNFEGVDSCFFVWLNGRYVGYSQVSHSTSEFDVSDMLKDGRNKLAVLVLKWCDGSYLEDQDKFRMSGIFRDVYLLKRPESFIFDYFVNTRLEGNNAEVSVRLKTTVPNVPVEVTIYDADNQTVGRGVAEETESDEYPQIVNISLENPKLWNAEEPYIYTMVLETKGEIITDYLGIREIKLQNGCFCINGSPIKFHGVNRHDSDPFTGFTVSIEQMKTDLLLMKEHNFNAIRTSHYPNAPVFYLLCDRYGFYVMDEADHESHGVRRRYLQDDSWENLLNQWNKPITENPDWLEAALDRTQRCVYRDKNRPCVIIWSMGNESSYGLLFEEALAWTKQYDPSRPTHYQGSLRVGNDQEYDFSNLDLYSAAYVNVDKVQEHIESNPNKLYMLMEYCHAMGNGPGDLEDYFEFIQKYDEFCGGFVWEWCDHAIYKGKHENGKAIFYYGGDHGEYPHDGNFCVDGLVFPDRRPHTGLLEYKNVYRPARVADFNQETKTLTLHNYMDYKNLKDYLWISWEINCDGNVVSTGHVKENMISVKPHKEGELQIDFQIPERGKTYLKLYYYLKEDTEILPADYLLGYEEILLKNSDERNQAAVALLSRNCENREELRVEQDEQYVTVSGENFSYTYGKWTGVFEKMSYGGKELLNHPMEINIWRAPTDNDRRVKNEWLRAGYNRTTVKVYKTSYEKTAEGISICSDLSIGAISIRRILNLSVRWIISYSGAVRAHLIAKKDLEFPFLPRFGIRMFLPKEMDHVTFYGMGPYESYCDKHRASTHGRYSASVADMHEDYIYPQENGSHYDCDYVLIEGKEVALTVVGEKTFSFNSSIYTQEELTAKNHNYELVPCDSTVLCIDYAQSGIGSGSCGTELLTQYRLNDENISFQIELVPSLNNV